MNDGDTYVPDAPTGTPTPPMTPPDLPPTGFDETLSMVINLIGTGGAVLMILGLAGLIYLHFDRKHLTK